MLCSRQEDTEGVIIILQRVEDNHISSIAANEAKSELRLHLCPSHQNSDLVYTILSIRPGEEQCLFVCLLSCLFLAIFGMGCSNFISVAL